MPDEQKDAVQDVTLVVKNITLNMYFAYIEYKYEYIYIYEFI